MRQTTDVRRAHLAHRLARAESRVAEAQYHAEQFPGDGADAHAARAEQDRRKAEAELADYDRCTAAA
jgi:hypothetical protein